MNSGHYGFPNILGLLRATAFRAIGKPGVTAGAALAGATTSGAPTSGTFDLGDVVVGQDGTARICTAAGSPGTWAQVGDPSTLGTRYEPLCDATGSVVVAGTGDPVMVLVGNAT